MAVSQKQIAEKLGVSIALISRVLSGKAAEIGIAPATIERVTKAAAEMGYVPSAAALSLKGKSTRIIGVAVYDFNDPFFGALIKQIQIQAHANNYSLVLAGFLNRIPDNQDLQTLHKHSIDGLIVIGSDQAAPWLSKFSHLPVARIGHGNADEKTVRVSIDENNAAHQLLSHLTETGRKRLVYISADQPAHRTRGEAIQIAAKEIGLELAIFQSTETDAYRAGLEALEQLTDAPDALLCATDSMAMGTLRALHNTTRAELKNVAVTGFDDIAVAAQFIPSLTTVRQPVEQIAERAFAAVIEKHEPGEVLFAGQLVCRETT